MYDIVFIAIWPTLHTHACLEPFITLKGINFNPDMDK